MGIQPKGMFGGFYKKTGPLVGRRGKRNNIITGLHHTTNKPATELQATQQKHFTLLTQFLNGLCILVTLGFKQSAKSGSALNAAIHFNFKHAFTIQGGQISLNFQALVYSRGNIGVPNCPALTLTSPLTVTFSWLAETQSIYIQNTDLATFVIYNETKAQFIIKQNIANRSTLSYSMQLPQNYSGDTLHTYMNFVNSTEKFTGNSIYIEKLKLPP